MFKRCAHCGRVIHAVGGKWEHMLPPYVFCLRTPKNLGTKATPR